ncbi:MAG: shikimate kinase [Bryobacterales bacterium]|nr:shikimate kinase [Bryobacterales bacterium]
MILKLKQTPGIYLAGFMASGKTTIGRALAQRIGWHFADLDYDIEAEYGTTIAKIFDERGEAEFRRIETEAVINRVNKIRLGVPTILALGGGTYSHPGNAELIENNGISLWIDCPFEVISQRVLLSGHRPNARDPVRFRQLFLDRQAFYAKAAMHVFVTDDDPERTVDQILQLPLFDE